MPLHLAVMDDNDRYPAVAALLASKADVNAVSKVRRGTSTCVCVCVCVCVFVCDIYTDEDAAASRPSKSSSSLTLRT